MSSYFTGTRFEIQGDGKIILVHRDASRCQDFQAQPKWQDIGRQIWVDILSISAAKHILWQLVWEKKHILLLCSMLHESGYP